MRYEAKEVRDAARGNWGEILGELCPSLVDAVHRAPRHGSCPIHGGTDGFRLFRDYEESGGGICNTCGSYPDGFAMLQWVNGWTFPQALTEVGEFLGLEPTLDVHPILDSKVGHFNDAANRLRLQEMWRQTVADNGVISNYLKSRGLSGEVPLSLRLHPSLPYYDKDKVLVGYFPCMLAPVQSPKGEMVSLHRTYLSLDGSGKAAVEQAKKLVKSVYPGATRGAAIRLGPIGKHINVTEGIETGIAVMEHTKRTSLSAVSAGGLERFDPPPGVHTVTIYSDNDLSFAGQRSSSRALRRLMGLGYVVEIQMPEEIGKDWLDILTKL